METKNMFLLSYSRSPLNLMETKFFSPQLLKNSPNFNGDQKYVSPQLLKNSPKFNGNQNFFSPQLLVISPKYNGNQKCITLFTCKPLVLGMSQIIPVHVLPSLWGKIGFNITMS